MSHSKTMEDVNIMETNPVTEVEEDKEHKTTGIGVDAVAVQPTVILHITVEHTECVRIRANTVGTHKMATKRT